MKQEPARTPASKAKILEHAAELFYHSGYHATSVDDILRGSRVAKSNFYYHFASKEELGRQVLDREMERFDSLARISLLNPALSPRDRLAEFFGRIARGQATTREMGGCPFGNLTAALSNRAEGAAGEQLRARLAEAFEQIADCLTACLAEGIACGELRGDIHPKQAAELLLAGAEGLLLLGRIHRDPQRLAEGLRQLLNCVVTADG